MCNYFTDNKDDAPTPKETKEKEKKKVAIAPPRVSNLLLNLKISIYN